MIVHFRAHRVALMTISCNSGLEFFRMSKEEEEEEEEEEDFIKVLLSLTS